MGGGLTPPISGRVIREMAEAGEDALEKIREQITCPICLVQYTEPKELLCHHVFCKKCLESLTVNNFDAPETMTITCPVCRKDTPIPGCGEGVAKLQTAFHIQNLLDIQNDLKEHVVSISGDRNKIVDIKDDTRSCAIHRNEKANLFCESCKDFICIHCIVQAHHQHNYNLVEEASKKGRESLISELKPAAMKLEIMETAMSKFQERGEEILFQREEIEGQIHSVIDHLQEALERKQTALIDRLQEVSSSKLVALNMQKSEVHTLKAKLNHCVDDINSMLKNGSDEEVLSEKDECMSMLRDISSNFDSFDTYPKERANIFLTSELESSLQNLEGFATIGTYNECPSKCHASGAGLTSATVGETASATVYILDHRGKPCPEGCGNEIEFEIVAAVNGKRVGGKATRRKAHQYVLSYQPAVKGYHRLSITIKNEHIFGSPFQLMVKSNFKLLGTPIQSIPNMTSPCGIALTETGTIIIVSDKKKGITLLKQNGELVSEIGVGNYTDVAVGTDNSLYVVSTEDHEVHNFTPDGTLIKTAGRVGEDGPLKFKYPRGVTFNSNNNKVYITNTNNHEIQVLNHDLSFYKRFGEEGTGKAQFKFPRGICCNSSGKVIIADSRNNRVQVFTPEGRLERVVSNPMDHLRLPIGVATDAAGHIYVTTESGNDRVSIFGRSGKFVQSFGEESGLSKPAGIAVDKNCGFVVVCNNGKNCIQIY